MQNFADSLHINVDPQMKIDFPSQHNNLKWQIRNKN